MPCLPVEETHPDNDDEPQPWTAEVLPGARVTTGPDGYVYPAGGLHPSRGGNRVHGDALVVGDMKILRWENVMPQVCVMPSMMLGRSNGSSSRRHVVCMQTENGWFLPPGQDPTKVCCALGNACLCLCLCE